MRYYFLIQALFLSLNILAQSAIEKDSLELNSFGNKTYVNCLKINKFDSILLQELQPPIYLFNEANFTFTKRYLTISDNEIANFMEMDTLNMINDSINNCKEKELNYIIKQSNERIDNFKNGYLQCQDINKELSRMLDDSIKLNKDQNKATKWGKVQYLVWGFLGGGLLGTFIGFQAVH